MQLIGFLGTWFKDHWLSLAKYGLVAAATAAVFVGVSLVGAQQREELSVITEWNDAIRRLGIQPVFPPEEDIYVGDVFAVITDDRRRSKDPKAARQLAKDAPLLGRAIKIHSQPMNDYLTAVYNSLPLFPPTSARPVSDADPWKMPEKTEGIFGASSKRGVLALAAFPGLTIRRDRGESGGLAGLGAMLAATRHDNDILELKIPLAETYGVPSLVASGIFDQLCSKDGLLANVCNDAAIRQQLSYVFGAGVEEREEVPGSQPNTTVQRYLVDVEMVFVSRVYLARSIEQKRGVTRDVGARVSQRLSEEPIKDEGKTGTSTDDNGKRLDALEAVLRRLQADGTKGGMAGIEYNSDNTITLKQTFERPLVFGYRAVSKRFPPRLDALNQPVREDTER